MRFWDALNVAARLGQCDTCRRWFYWTSPLRQVCVSCEGAKA